MIRLFFIICLLFANMPQSWATVTSQSQYQSAYRQTTWNNITDSMHTIGQTPKQAAWTKMRLRNTRVTTRINNINRAKRQAWLNSQ